MRPQAVDKHQRMSLRAVGSDPLIAPPFKRSGGMWDSHTSDVGHSLQVLGDEGALELVRAFGRFGMTENQLCLHIEGASFDAPSKLKTQISKLSQPLASAGITISGTLLNWDRVAVAMQLPILISILTPLMPWDSSIMSKRFFIRFSITTAMSMV